MTKFRASKKDYVFAGVCGGISEHYYIDSLWIRLAFVFIPHTLIIYIVLMFIMDEA